jgi:hypothetical protein
VGKEEGYIAFHKTQNRRFMDKVEVVQYHHIMLIFDTLMLKQSYIPVKLTDGFGKVYVRKEGSDFPVKEAHSAGKIFPKAPAQVIPFGNLKPGGKNVGILEERINRMGLAVTFAGDHGNKRAFKRLGQALIEMSSLQIKRVLKNRSLGILKKVAGHFILLYTLLCLNFHS